MKIVKDDEVKIVEIWLTAKEDQDNQLKAALALFADFLKTQKYIVCYYISGKKDVYQMTKSLIMNNLKG